MRKQADLKNSSQVKLLWALVVIYLLRKRADTTSKADFLSILKKMLKLIFLKSETLVFEEVKLNENSKTQFEWLPNP